MSGYRHPHTGPVKTDNDHGVLRNQVCTENINFLHLVLLAYQLKINLVESRERRGISSHVKSGC